MREENEAQGKEEEGVGKPSRESGGGASLLPLCLRKRDFSPWTSS